MPVLRRGDVVCASSGFFDWGVVLLRRKNCFALKKKEEKKNPIIVIVLFVFAFMVEKTFRSFKWNSFVKKKKKTIFYVQCAFPSEKIIVLKSIGKLHTARFSRRVINTYCIEQLISSDSADQRVVLLCCLRWKYEYTLNKSGASCAPIQVWLFYFVDLSLFS